MNKQNVIVVTVKAAGTVKVYSNLKPILSDFPNLARSKVEYKLSRVRKPFEDENIIIEKKPIIYSK